jgi:hypothetical protein
LRDDRCGGGGNHVGASIEAVRFPIREVKG